MDSILASSAVDRVFWHRSIVCSGTGQVKPKTIELVFVASPLNTQY